MQVELRPYQVEAIEMIDAEFRKGNRRILLCASPGLGKTTISAFMIQRAIKYNMPCLFVVRGRDLVINASDRFREMKIDHSVYMSKDWRFEPKKLVQCCSVDTMFARDRYPHQDGSPLIFLDEAHKNYKKVFEMYPNAFIIGMTGSPFAPDMSMYQSYVEPIKPYEARDMGFLVPDKIFCPHIIDISAVKITAGDFNQKQLESVVTNSAVVGNVISDWLEFGENRPTVVFATSINHSLQLKHAFIDVGIKAIHCDASSTDEERKKAREDLESGKVKVLCNVDIFSVGWNCPSVSCIVLARPTWSLVWYLQAVGRGVRDFPGKSDCIVLDNAANVFRHGTHFKVREISLEPKEKKTKKEYDTKITSCSECYFIYDPTIHKACPDCGHIKEAKERRVNEIDGKLIEYEEHQDDTAKRRKAMIIKKFRELEWGRKKGNLRPEWTFIQLRKDYSREEMVHLKEVVMVPERFLPLPNHPLQ